MNRIQALQEKQKKEMDDLLTKIALEGVINEQVAAVPSSILLTEKAHWVSFKKKKLEEALALFNCFLVVPFFQYRDSCTLLQPEALPRSDRYVKESGPYAVLLETTAGEGYGPDAELVFWASVDKSIVRVNIKVGDGYIGTCPLLRPKVMQYGSPNGHICDRTYTPNASVSKHSDKVIRWASNRDRTGETSFHASFLFKAETEVPLGGISFKNALQRLQQVIQDTGA